MSREVLRSWTACLHYSKPFIALQYAIISSGLYIIQDQHSSEHCILSPILNKFFVSEFKHKKIISYLFHYIVYFYHSLVPFGARLSIIKYKAYEPGLSTDYNNGWS